jgi:hypothetical protein
MILNSPPPFSPSSTCIHNFYLRELTHLKEIYVWPEGIGLRTYFCKPAQKFASTNTSEFYIFYREVISVLWRFLYYLYMGFLSVLCLSARLCVEPSLPPLVCLPFVLSVCPTFCPPALPSVCPPLLLFARPSSCPPALPSVLKPFFLSTRPSFCPPAHPSVRPPFLLS